MIRLGRAGTGRASAATTCSIAQPCAEVARDGSLDEDIQRRGPLVVIRNRKLRGADVMRQAQMVHFMGHTDMAHADQQRRTAGMRGTRAGFTASSA